MGFSIFVNICYHLFFNILRFTTPIHRMTLPCSLEQSGQFPPPPLQFSLCHLLRTRLQWKSREVRLWKVIGPFPFPGVLTPVGTIDLMISKHMLPYFVFLGIDFRRGGGHDPQNQKCLFIQTIRTPCSKRGIPFPTCLLHIDSHHSLSLWRDHTQLRHTELSCFENHMHS